MTTGTRLGLALLLLAGLGACRSGSNGPTSETVRITIHYSRFDPHLLAFAPATTVRFVVRNTDPIDHEFILGDEELQRVHEQGTEAHHDPRPGEMSVPAGTTQVTSYTFTEPGTLIFGCHLPGHYAYGMHGTVTIG